MTGFLNRQPLLSRAKRRSRAGAWRALALFLLSLLLLAVAIAPPVATALVVSRPLARVDAIIALASHEWERLPLAAALAGAHPDAIVVLTVPQPATPFNCHDCANRVDRLRHLGVAEGRVRLLPIGSPGTYGEALAALAYAREARVGHLLIVTSPYHTRRSLATFRKVFANTGIEIGIQPASATSPARPTRWLWVGYDRAYVAYEWTAISYYRWRYGV